MPKLKRERSKQHTVPPQPQTTEWQQAGPGGRTKKMAQNASMTDEITVSDRDLRGLDVNSGAHESEASKRAAMAEALKELISMDDDDDESDGMGSDEDDEMTDEIKMPAKGTLFKQSKTSAAASSATSSAKPATQPPVGLKFAPSAPARSTANGPAADEPAAPGTVPFKKPSKQDKREARHQQLMNRLGLPGTNFGGRGQKKHGASGGFTNLKLDFASALLTPSEQNARTLAARKESQQEQKRDVLFLSDGPEKERMVQMQADIAETKAKRQAAYVAAAKQQQQQTGLTPSGSSSSFHQPQHVPSQPAPSPFSKNKPLTAAQRQKLKRQELQQFTAVLHHPSFQAGPLAALQLHTQNSIAMAKLQAEQDGIMQDDFQPSHSAVQSRRPSTSHKKKNK